MAKAVAKMAPKSKPAPQLPAALMVELERRRAGLARHMARAVVAVVHWDDSTGVPPQRDAIAKACEAGLDLFLATAREARPATAEELRRVAQLGILQARSSQSVEPILAAYRIAARVAWDAILRAWRGHPAATPEAIMLSDNYDSELELQKQALALNMPIAATGYVAVVSKLVVGKSDGARGGEALGEVAASLDVPRGAIHHVTDPSTLVTLWPAESPAHVDGARNFVTQLHKEAVNRSGPARARVRAGIGGYHPGLRGISRSYLEAQQAIEAGRKLRPDDVSHKHDEVIPHLVLAQNPRLAERFVAHTLGPLLDPKARNREQLLDTLEAYLANGSVKDAAAALNLHRHTVLYRLDKLREILGGELDTPASRLRLQLALDLRKLI